MGTSSKAQFTLTVRTVSVYIAKANVLMGILFILLYSPCIMCVQYIGGCSVHQGDIMSTSGGYHEYIGGCSVHRGDIMMNVGGYHEHIGGCSVLRRDTMSTSGGYHEYIGGIS